MKRMQKKKKKKMKTNTDLKNFVNMGNFKVLVIALFAGLTLGACKTYKNSVVMVKNNKVLMKDDSSNEERLVDCTKKNSKYPKLLEDLPYFHEGDPIDFRPAKGYTYDGFRAYPIEGSTFNYNLDTVQVRKDREKIEQFKAEANQNVR